MIKSPSPLLWTKMSGTGNDFIITNLIRGREGLEACFPQKTLSEITQIICDRHHHVGADGAVFLLPSERGSHFAWEFFNSDGSTAEMCGNAARCVVLYAFARNLAPQSLTFDSMAGPILGEVLGANQAQVVMPEVRGARWGESLKVGDSEINCDYLNTGVPHVVHQIEAYHVDESLLQRARELRRHPSLPPEGANVTFYCVETPGNLRSITFERGVENWTLSCGTGAVAAAASYAHWSGDSRPVTLSVPGGDLKVGWSKEGKPRLAGSVKFIADLQLYG